VGGPKKIKPYLGVEEKQALRIISKTVLLSLENLAHGFFFKVRYSMLSH